MALFSTALIADVVFLALVRRDWLDRAVVLLYAVAALSAGAAALSGTLAAEALTDTLTEGAKGLVALHGESAFFTVVLFFLVAIFRFDTVWRQRASGARLDRARIGALVLALAAEWAVLLTADRGGRLVYHHGVGVERPHVEPR